MSAAVVTIDWTAAERVAERLGNATCQVVAQRDAAVVQTWALRMARDWGIYPRCASRVAAYLDLARIVGYQPPNEPLPEAEEAGPE